jgi:hypothetical protein
MGIYLSREFFSNPLRPEQPPLSGHIAMEALYRAEVIDSYRQLVQISAPNRLARKTVKYLPNLYPVNKVLKHSASWPHGQVVWMDPDSDMGLPHTRPPNLICIPTNISDSILTSTLLHEQVHLSQRIYPSQWSKILESAWSMTPWTGDLPEDILLRRRINPDLVLGPMFQWDEEWVPVAIFKSLTSPVLNDVDIVWWQISTRSIHRQAPPGWVEFFGTVDGGHEHPYELSAYMIEKDNSPTEAYKKLKVYLKDLPRTEL